MWSSPTESAGATPPGRCLRCGRGLGALALAALGAGCMGGGPLRTVRSSLENVDAGAAKTRTQSNLVEIAMQDRLGPDFEYRFNDRFVQSSQSISTAGNDADDEATSHRPSLDLVLNSGPLTWTQMFQRQTDRALLDNAPDNKLVRDDILQKLEWMPENLPQVTGWIDFRNVEDEFNVDQDTVEVQLQVHQALEPFEYDYSFRDLRTDDKGVDVESERTEHLLSGTYQDTFDDGKVTTNLGLFANERSSDQHFPLGTVAPLQVSAVSAFSDVDLTPQISTLTNNPALIDTILANSAGIDIGGFASGGQLSWNMGVELPPGTTVDLVQLKTTAVVPANFANQFTFSVWASDDGTFWTLVKGSAAYVYDPAFQYFKLTIPGVSKRYLKVVNSASPGAAPAVLISEFEIYRASGGGNSRTTSYDESIRSATGDVSWRLTESFSVGYDLLAQTSDATLDGTQARDETRLENGVWANWAATEKVDANVRFSDQNSEDPVLVDEDLRTAVGVLSYRPLATLDLDLSYSNSHRTLDGDDDFTTQTSQALATAQLLRTLRAELSVERSEQEDFQNQRTIDHWIGSGALVAQLTRTLETTLRVRNDDASVSGPGAAGIPDPSELRYELDLLLRPSDQLIAEGEFQWVDAFAGSGLDQRLRLDWLPFPDGAIDVQIDYYRIDNQSFTNETSDRYSGRARYSMTPRTYLELQYAAEVTDGGSTIELVTLVFSFTN